MADGKHRYHLGEIVVCVHGEGGPGDPRPRGGVPGQAMTADYTLLTRLCKNSRGADGVLQLLKEREDGGHKGHFNQVDLPSPVRNFGGGMCSDGCRHKVCSFYSLEDEEMAINHRFLRGLSGGGQHTLRRCSQIDAADKKKIGRSNLYTKKRGGQAEQGQARGR